MKKNRMMRAASALLVAVLLTTCTISGTFAKYVTEATGTDTARVAKFGVEVSVSNGLFATSYVNVEGGNNPGDTNATVVSSNSDKLIAPGTQNGTGMTFKITGQPEVDVKVEFSIDNATRKDVFLKAADDKYLNYTTGNDTTDKFNLANNYHPLLFTLKDGKGNVINGLENVNILTIEDYLENTLSKVYDANTNLTTIVPGNDGTYVLTWKWAFENGLDEADTLLGNLAADAAKFGAGLTAGTDYNLGAHLDFAITVTQVD